MKNALALTFAMMLTLAWTGVGLAQCDTTFQVSDGEWDKPSNWDNETPESGETACLQANQIARVQSSSTNDGMCGAVVVPSTSKIVVEADALLEFINTTKTSDIDGSIELERATTGSTRAVLLITGCPTFSGDGDIVGLTTGVGSSLAHIDANGGDLTISGNLELHGRMEISADLTNNSSVSADADGYEIQLTETTKSGTGDWVAENGGTLKVAIATSGAGAWKLIDDEDSVIEFTVDCISLTGPFTIQKGTVDLSADNVDVDSTGILTFQSTGGSKPRIKVPTGGSFCIGS